MGIIPDKYFSEISKWFRRETGGGDSGKGKGGWLALSPLLVFLGVYLVSSLIANDFYKIPIASAFLIASVYALIVSRGSDIEQKIAMFSEGAGNKNVLLMIWIFILAGAFASTAKDIGAIDATVNLALRILPGKCCTQGFFSRHASFRSPSAQASAQSWL